MFMTKKQKMTSLTIIGFLIILFITLGILYSNNYINLNKNNDLEDEIELNFEISNDNVINFTTSDIIEEDIVVTIKPIITFSTNMSKKIKGTYNLELNVINNLFVYSDVENKTPEITMKIITPDNEELTEILGLIYENGVFDITGFFGPIKVIDKYEIDSKNNNQQWSIEIIFKKLEVDQTENLNKMFKAEIIPLSS